MKSLHAKDVPNWGVFGAELTLFKFPGTFDIARQLANRGLFLEVVLTLRLCLEMTAWSYVVYHIADEDLVTRLKAQSCIREIKNVYQTAGILYGRLSKFAHWEHEIHHNFIDMTEDRISLIRASAKYRAISLTLCLIILDVFVEVIRHIYGRRSNLIVGKIQGSTSSTVGKNVHKRIADIADLTSLKEVIELKSMLR